MHFLNIKSSSYIIVAGGVVKPKEGTNATHHPTSSTEIYYLDGREPEIAGNMTKPRYFFALAKIGKEQQILAFGGATKTEIVKNIEKWDHETKSWINSPMNLKEPLTFGFGSSH